MADILLTHSYHLAYDPKQTRKMQPYAPLGTLYAASALRARGYSVAIFDPMLEDPKALTTAMAAHRPRVVAVYEDDFNFLSKMCLTRMREVAWEIAKAAVASNAIAVVHGSDSSDHADLFLRNGFDYVLCGEAEETLGLLCDRLLRAKRTSEIDGLVSLGQDGTVIRSGQRLARNARWPELDLPARDLIDLESYRAAWMKAHGYFSVNMVSSRGCPYHCNWCAKPVSGNRFHLRPAASVAEEMKLVKEEVGAEHIWFGDDVFALDHRWVEQFAVEVICRNAALPFKIQSRADLMRESVVRGLKTAGCEEVWMGVESGSQFVLNAMDKGLRLSDVVAARTRLKQAGIRACFFLQFGYPGETWERLQETISFVRETRPDDIGVSFSYPLPGTAFYQRVQEQLGKKRNWRDSDDLCIMFKGAYTTDFYRAVRDALHAEVSSWSLPEGDCSAQFELSKLWRRVEEIEPHSRQADAMNEPESLRPMDLVPLHTLTAAGEV